MNDKELISEVIKYYENNDHPFSYSVAGQLEVLGDDNKEWKSLARAYLNGDFTPTDCRFMYGCNVVLVETCPKCETELKDAPGIGPYCPNKECDVVDNILCLDQQGKCYITFPVSDADMKTVVQECIDVIMNSTDRHRKEYFADLLKKHFGVE